MDSIRSSHARLAALIRHRGADDPAVRTAREELDALRILNLITSDETRQIIRTVLDDLEGSAPV